MVRMRVTLGKAVVIRLDVADFFPSITRRRVKGIFTSFGYSEGVAAVLALLTTDDPRDGTHDGVAGLPQGAPTSPAISNIVCSRLDARLNGLARKHSFDYSRYADDMTFSHPSGDAPVGRLISSAGSFSVRKDSSQCRPRPESCVPTNARS